MTQTVIKALFINTVNYGWMNYPVIDSMDRQQEARFINEPNLYRLITHSKLPSAEKFEKWVFEEVLPTIRKTGHYGKPSTLPRANNINEIVNLGL